MGRFPQKAGTRGSLKWMQKVVNEKQEYINNKIRDALDLSKNENISWLSPLVDDEYAEYRDKAFLDVLDIELDEVSLGDFWPLMGPQWDGLAKTESGKIILVEAKSHIPELTQHAKPRMRHPYRRLTMPYLRPRSI